MEKQGLILCLLLLACVIAQNSASFLPTNVTKNLSQRDEVYVCRESGFMCQKDCSEVHLCIQGKATKSFVDILISTCTPETGMCDITSGTCSTKVTACYQETKFRCFDIGSFPDPYDCTKFHICYPDAAGTLTDLTLNCPTGYAYNPLTVSCSLKTTDGVCVDGPVEKCKKLAQTNSLRLNQSIYYICALESNVLYPQLRRCKHGHWNPSLFRCED